VIICHGHPSSPCTWTCKPTLKSDKDLEKRVDVMTCSLCLGHDLEWIRCNVKIRCDIVESVDDENRQSIFNAVYQCSGSHDHACPPVVKPDADALDVLEKIVTNDPSRKPLKISVGLTDDGEMEVTSAARFLHSAFVNQDRLAFHRRKILEKYGISEQTDSIMLAKLQEEYGPGLVVSSSVSVVDCHVCVQTDGMRIWLTSTKDNGRDLIGVLSDITYRYFKNGFFLSSCVYNSRLCRWVPILYTFVKKIDEFHHIPHFKVILRQLRVCSCYFLMI
jgi:hypothetical protein